MNLLAGFFAIGDIVVQGREGYGVVWRSRPNHDAIDRRGQRTTATDRNGDDEMALTGIEEMKRAREMARASDRVFLSTPRGSGATSHAPRWALSFRGPLVGIGDAVEWGTVLGSDTTKDDTCAGPHIDTKGPGEAGLSSPEGLGHGDGDKARQGCQV